VFAVLCPDDRRPKVCPDFFLFVQPGGKQVFLVLRIGKFLNLFENRPDNEPPV